MLTDLLPKQPEPFRRGPGQARRVRQHRRGAAADVGARHELAAMTTVARAILNLHETDHEELR